MKRASTLPKLAFALLLTAPLIPLTAGAQEQRPQVNDASRDPSGDEPYDTPELFGSTPHELRHSDRLPALVAEYTVRSGTVFQRISMFDNNVASHHIRGLGAPMQRRIVLAPEAVETVRSLIKMVDPASIRAAEARLHERGNDYAQLRFQRDGVTHEILCGSREVVSQQLEAVRGTLGELLTLIAEDRQIVNPVSTYAPVVGDVLRSDDGTEYRISRIVAEGTLVELEGVKQPLHLYVATSTLYKMFMSVRGSAAPARGE
jgi:hypothetical protein